MKSFPPAPPVAFVSAPEFAPNAGKFRLVDSVMAHLTPQAIARLARKQLQAELRAASRSRNKAGRQEATADRAMRLACKAQSRMEGGKAQTWAADLFEATGIDARTATTVYANRYETIGDFLGLPTLPEPAQD